MNSNRQLINLAGLLLVIAILVAGVALVALPMWAQSQTIDVNTLTVEQTNAVYEAQISQLSAAEDGIGQVDADLAALRAEIPVAMKLDEAFEIITTAASRAGVAIKTITFTDPEQWAPRAGIQEEGVAVVPSTPAAVDEKGEGEADSDAAAPAAGSASVDGAAVAAAGPDPRQQLSATIVMDVPDAKSAMAFVDGLGVGPRVLAPIDAKLDDGTLTVTVLTFFRTED